MASDFNLKVKMWDRRDRILIGHSHGTDRPVCQSVLDQCYTMQKQEERMMIKGKGTAQLFVERYQQKTSRLVINTQLPKPYVRKDNIQRYKIYCQNLLRLIFHVAQHSLTYRYISLPQLWLSNSHPSLTHILRMHRRHRKLIVIFSPLYVPY